jgi:hypothetical protein
MPGFEKLANMITQQAVNRQQMNPALGLAAVPPTPNGPAPVRPPAPQISAPQGFLANPPPMPKSEGGLPIRVILSVQGVYQQGRQAMNVQGNHQQQMGLEPGWGGRGRT